MKQYVGIYDGTMTDDDLDVMLATQTQDGLMSKEDKIKLDNLSGGGGSVPVESIEASKVIQDTDHRFVTDTEKSTWNTKAGTDKAETEKDGLMSKEDKTKLDGIEEGANKYVHPENHPATVITEDETHRFVTDAEKEKWNAIPTDKETLGLGNVTNDAQVKRSEMGVASGVATLDESGKVPASQLPGFVDDVVEVENYAALPPEGEAGKIYVDLETNKTYRWGGSSYVDITGNSLALGETSATAYAGDKGKAVTDEVNKIKDGSTVVPKAQDAATVNSHTVEANVPEDAKFTDTVYTHPENHPATVITEDETHRFVTDVEKSTWNGKADAVKAEAGVKDGLMSKEDKTKLDGIEANANNYTHPANHDASVITETTEKKFVSDAQIAKWDAKADVTAVSGEANGLMLSSDKTKLDGIAANANNYVHPDSHEATMITETAEKKFVSDSEKAAWNAKADKTEASSDAAGLMSAADKAKLDAIEAQANKYEHPAKHEATIITEDATHRFVTDEEKAAWNTKAPMDKAEAGTKDGLMSKEDKTKLDGIEEGANKYTHPENHPATVITEDETHRFVTDAEKEKWNALPADKEAIGLGNVTNDAQVKRSEMGVASGVATLDESGKVPASQLPSYVDDVVEVENYDALPETGEAGKIYVDIETNTTYRWSGSQYTKTASDLSLGETSSTAYAGDKGKANADEIEKIKSGTTVVPKAQDAATVNSHTVEANVPEDAKFTDTVYEHPANHDASIITETSEKKFVSDAQIAKWDAKADTTVVSGEANGLMSSADKTKLDGIAVNANNYVHPEKHEATVITEDETHRFVTDVEKAAWNNKADKTEATGELAGLMSAVDKAKLDGLVGVPVNFSMETESLNPNVINVTYGEGKELKLQMYLPQEQFDGKSCFITDELASFYSDLGGHPVSYDMKEWDEETNRVEDLTAENGPYLVLVAMNVKTKPEPEVNTFEYVTSLKSLFEGYVKKTDKAEAGTKDGLMSKEDKTKLDGIEDGANNYEHPANHEATVITEDATHRFVTDEEKSTWNNKADKTEVSGEAAGLMSIADKAKLDGIDPKKIPDTAKLVVESKTINFSNSGEPDTVLFSVDLSPLFQS